MNNNTESAKTVEAVERACSVIQALKELDGAGVTELSKYLGMSKSGTHKQLATLVKEGYVTKEHSEYRLGFQFIANGEYVKNNSLFYRVGESEIDDLAEKCHDCAYLTVLEHDQIYCIFIAEGDNAVAANMKVGQRISGHSSAAGKAILSHMAENNREQLLPRKLPEKTSSTITDRDELEDELKSVKEHGIAFEDEENVHGMRGIASPILSPENEILGAVGVSGPISLLTDERFRDELPKLVRQSKNFIEVKFSLESRDPYRDGSHVPEGFY